MVNDGIFASNTAAKTVSVAAVNDAPVNSVPGAPNDPMNTAKVFSSGNSNLISVTDVTPPAGRCSPGGQHQRRHHPVGYGRTDHRRWANGSANMTFTGSFAAVNTALAGLSFNPTTSFTGAASLQIVTADQGNTGSGGTQTDNDTVAITVAASARPVVTAPVANLAYTENASAVALDTGILVADSDSNITGATISMTTNYVSGQDALSFGTQNGITGSWVAGTGVLTLSGSATPPTTRRRCARSPTSTAPRTRPPATAT